MKTNVRKCTLIVPTDCLCLINYWKRCLFERTWTLTKLKTFLQPQIKEG